MIAKISQRTGQIEVLCGIVLLIYLVKGKGFLFKLEEFLFVELFGVLQIK